MCYQVEAFIYKFFVFSKSRCKDVLNRYIFVTYMEINFNK